MGLDGQRLVRHGVTTLCAYSREKLGWLGRDNQQLVVLEQPVAELRLNDVFEGGEVFKVFIEEESEEVDAEEREYLLFEQRFRSSQYYNRQLPVDGAFVWHIRPLAMDNKVEEYKLVDLVCADGMYSDAGYPDGRVVDLHTGGDNLDFWAHDNRPRPGMGRSYTRSHAGNLGDAGDMFVGRGGLYEFDAGIDASLDVYLTMVARNEARMASLRKGLQTPTAVYETAEDTVSQVSLLPNYPNPFNPQTTIGYVLPEAAQVQLVVYNALGQKVRTLIEDEIPAGTHESVWDSHDDSGHEVASGIYHYSLEVEGHPPYVRRMTLIR